MKITKPSRLVAFFFPWRQRRYEAMLAAKRETRRHRGQTLKTCGRFCWLNTKR